MKTSRLVGIFLLSFAVLAAARAPLGLVARLIAGSDLTYSLAEGTVWSGTLHTVAAAGAPLGDLSVKTSPLSILALSPRIDWTLDGPVSGRGQAAMSWVSGTLTLREVMLDAELAQLPSFIALNGTLAATVDKLVWGTEGCLAAKGKMRTNALVQRPGGVDWQGPLLAGDIACVGKKLRLTMHGRNTGGLISVRAEVEPQLAYRLNAMVRTSDARLPRMLPMFGFKEEDDDYRLVRTGQFGSGKQRS